MDHDARTEMFSSFQAMASSRQPIRLMNLFKGVPIAYEAELLRVGVDSIVARTELFQIVCLYREQKTYLQSEKLPMVLTAAVRALHVPDLQVELAEFAPAQHSLGDRTQVRVQPEEPLQGGILTAGASRAFQAELADISTIGLAIYIPQSRYDVHSYAPGAAINVVLKLPIEAARSAPRYASSSARRDPMARFDRDALRLAPLSPVSSTPTSREAQPALPAGGLNIRGRVAYSQALANEGRYRVGIRIQPDDPSPRYIRQFITQRQAEIIRELREIAAALRAERRAK